VPRARYERDHSRLTRAAPQGVGALLHAARCVEKAPPEVDATLLDAGLYPCSIRTMYRLVARADEVYAR
jgi:putative transposase